MCTSDGCFATRTGLDDKIRQIRRTPSSTSTFRFVDGRWQESPFRESVDMPGCLGVDGNVVPGSNTIVGALSAEPQADGTLNGVLTTTTVSNECGWEGSVVESPFVATRIGDSPAGVVIADPSSVTTDSSKPPPGPGPSLSGVYRLAFDFAGQTANGRPVSDSPPPQIKWYAFRSQCTPTRCVAVGTSLIPGNPNQADGVDAIVLRLTDGQWQSLPALVNFNCATNESTNWVTRTWSLATQSDGTTQGSETLRVITSECGVVGNVYVTPLTMKRTGDVPPTVVLADPALFLQ